MNDPTFVAALVAAAGSLAAGMLGWLDSGGPFNWRKFASNVIRSVTAGMVYALGQEVSKFSGVTLYFYAFLGGAGVDIILNRTQGGIGRHSAVPYEESIGRIARDLETLAESRTKGKVDES